MPGRRSPRRPPQAALNQHTRAAFPGGMDGGALIPTPVGSRRDDLSKRGGSGSQLLFYQDVFTGDGSTHTFPLTYRPLPHSERVFTNGLYCREGPIWNHAAGSAAVQVQFIQAPAAGTRIIVEYAYYAQTPAAVETFDAG